MISNFSRRAGDESVTSWRNAGLFAAADSWGFGARADSGVQAAAFTAGDIALIGYQADTINNAKSFAFVLLSEALRGQTISFTDNGWLAAGGFRTGEGTVSITIANDATIGSVFTLTGISGNFNLSTSGDQIAAYVGGSASPTFLFGLDFADGNAAYAGDATSSNTSAVPTGLTFGDTALAFGTDNGAYTGPLSGSKADILAAIADESNWTLDDAAAVGYAPGFTVTDDGAATVSIGDVSIVEGDAGTQVLTFTVSRSNNDGAFTIDYATGDGTAVAGDDYQGALGTLSFDAGGALTQTISVTINGDTTVEPNETFFVNLTNLVQSSGTAVVGDAQGIGTILTDDIAISYIHDIQGTAFFSPILAAEGISAFNVASAAQVTVRGIVTAIDSFAGSGTQGFYISEETTDWDGNVLTSEGIYVRTSAATAGLTVGETVTVTANVMESQSFSNLNRTILVNASSILQGNDANALPTFVIDGTPGHSIPTSIISDDSPNFRDSDGSSGTFDPQNDALDFYETIEGMRVTMTDMIVGDGFVGGSNDNFVFFNAYSYDNADKNFINSRGGYTAYGTPEFYPVNDGFDNPDYDVKYGGATSTDGALHGDIIELDFGDVGRGGTSAFDQDLTMGDSLGDVSGIIDFDFGVTKLYVTDALDPTKVAALDETTPIQEVTTLGGDDRALTVATFNVENLSPVGTTFSTNNGVEITTQEKYDLLAKNVAQNLNSPDIIIVEEVQDSNGVDPNGGTDATETWEQLVAAVNAATGKTYQWVDEAPETANDVGGAPGGNIRVGFLYDTSRVQLGDLAADATIEERRQYTDRIGDGVRDAGDKLAVDDTGAGIDPTDWSGTRRSIVGEFTFRGQTVNVFGSHLPSKGGSDDPYTIGQDNGNGNPTNGDWALRNTLAEQINNVFEKASATGGLLVSGGDYNEFWYNRPLEVLTGYANPDGTANTTGTKYVNLMVQELAPEERFSYDFDGRSQALDSLLTDQILAGVASYDAVHINTGYNDRAGANNPASSDHDPSLASFDFRNLAETLDGGAEADILDGFGGDDVLNGGDGDDTLAGGLGDDTLDGGAGFDGADYRDATVGVSVSLAIAGSQNTNWGADTLIGIERIYGSAFADTLTGDDRANRINSNGGADTISGGGGNDVIVLASNAASIDGGAGTDRVIVATALFGVTDATFTGVERLSVDDGAVVDLSGLSQLPGTVTIDSVAGGGALFTGSQGADKVTGGAGGDILAGDNGADTVAGGAGADVFAFRDFGEISAVGRRDLIADFGHADGDTIDLSSIDANPTALGVQHLTFIGSSRFSGMPGSYELRVTAPKNGNEAWRVQIDVNHDRKADHTFLVVSDGPLTAADFVLAPPAAFAPTPIEHSVLMPATELHHVRMDTVGLIHLA